ncbi:Crp/Fnr family transcriptional regulator [Xanthovirga aplysinae]|uniref:Crp/Fnr family transcriptional regulator n=1 Tax=Xanthovirga aplysinae TaxID=2529853 RepID=UPI0016574E79|nr:Crp/Fnr family transcriptional regulator [Xanthovirga aplysinae]
MDKLLEDFIKTHRIKEKDLIEELNDKAYISEFKKGEFLIKNNNYIKVLKIVLGGKVRVYQENQDREILIYHLKPMETCTLSLSACFEDCKSNVNAIAEEDGMVLNIPVRFVEQWSFKYESWHRFTINTFRESYSYLIENYSKLAFQPLKDRLLDYIIEKSNHNILNRSHAQLAKELGTTREVISRLLKKLEADKIVTLGQKSIKVL